MNDRRGFALIELIAVTVIVTVTLSVVATALLSPGTRSSDDRWGTRLDSACAAAIDTGLPTVALPDSAHVVPAVLFLPDGRSTMAAEEVRLC